MSVFFAFAAGIALPAWLAWHPQAGAQQVGTSAGAADTRILTNVLGAVQRPGPVQLAGEQATVDDALASAGGARADSYRFATLLLRTLAEASPRFPCVGPGARHAALLVSDDPALRGENALIDGLLDGRIQRMYAQALSFGRLGSDRGTQALLHSGDVLAVPQRSSRVYVVLSDGSVESAEHQPDLMADDYLAGMPADRLARRRDYVLHYPDGRLVGLALEGWNTEPAVVPPGSMLAPDAGCLPVSN